MLTLLLFTHWFSSSKKQCNFRVFAMGCLTAWRILHLYVWPLRTGATPDQLYTRVFQPTIQARVHKPQSFFRHQNGLMQCHMYLNAALQIRSLGSFPQAYETIGDLSNSVLTVHPKPAIAQHSTPYWDPLQSWPLLSGDQVVTKTSQIGEKCQQVRHCLVLCCTLN